MTYMMHPNGQSTAPGPLWINSPARASAWEHFVNDLNILIKYRQEFSHNYFFPPHFFYSLLV